MHLTTAVVRTQPPELHDVDNLTCAQQQNNIQFYEDNI